MSDSISMKSPASIDDMEMIQPCNDHNGENDEIDQDLNDDFSTWDGNEMFNILDFEEMEPICHGSSKDVNTTEMKSSKALHRIEGNYLLASTPSQTRRSSSPYRFHDAEPSYERCNPKMSPLQQNEPVSIAPSVDGLSPDSLDQLYEAHLSRLAISIKKTALSRIRLLKHRMFV